MIRIPYLGATENSIVPRVLYTSILRPLLFKMDPEKVHDYTHRLLRSVQESDQMMRLVRVMFSNVHSDRLAYQFRDIQFQNPVGLAAGFDKNATLIHSISALGFGFTEVGSITHQSSEGNTKPRLFRLPEDRAIINRMGLNNEGALQISRRINHQWIDSDIPVGINIAKTHSTEILGEKALLDYQDSYRMIRNLGDYHCLNISCPNTAEGKTFEDPHEFNNLLNVIQPFRNPDIPLLIKLSPDADITTLQEIITIAHKFNIDGFVVSNTSNSRSGLQTSSSRLSEIGRGGLSGAPLQNSSLETLRFVHQHRTENQLLIGVGGVMDTSSALEKLYHGADLIQIYSGLVYEGPALISRINRALDAAMAELECSTYEHFLTSLRSLNPNEFQALCISVSS